MKKISPNPDFKPRYGVAGAGAVSRSLIGSLPDRARTLGPICCVSYRVARRIANSLGGGFAVRSALDLKSVPVVLFHSPADHLETLLAVLEAENDDWTGRALVICETELDDSVAERFRRRGASVARVSPFELPGYLVIHGTGAALAVAHRLARELRLHPIEVKPGTESAFNAAVTLGTCALTPVLDAVATLLREAGLREAEAPKVAAAMFLKTAREYAHSGKQSWGWYAKSPDANGLLAEISGAGPETGPTLQHLILLGMEIFGKHPEVAAVIQKSF